MLLQLTSASSASERSNLRQRLATYLIKKPDFGLLEDILVPFEKTYPFSLDSVERNRPKSLAPVIWVDCQPVIDSLCYLSQLMLTLQLTDPPLNWYKSMCLPLVLGRWQPILGWLQTILWVVYPNLISSSPYDIRPLYHVLVTVIDACGDSDVSEELLSIPCTFDFFYLALQQTDPVVIGKTVSDIGHMILKVAGQILKRESVFKIYSSKFGILVKSSRERVVSGLVSRAKIVGRIMGVATDTSLNQLCARSLATAIDFSNFIIATNSSALLLCHKHDFLRE